MARGLLGIRQIQFGPLCIEEASRRSCSIGLIRIVAFVVDPPDMSFRLDTRFVGARIRPIERNRHASGTFLERESIGQSVARVSLDKASNRLCSRRDGNSKLL